jgi:hypothetical protein
MHIKPKRVQKNIDALLGVGLRDPEISQCFLTKNDALFFKRNVLLILGKKQS